MFGGWYHDRPEKEPCTGNGERGLVVGRGGEGSVLVGSGNARAAEGLQGTHYPHFSSSPRVFCVCVPSLALGPHPLLLFLFVRICTPRQLLYFPTHLIFYLPASLLAS